CSATASSSRFCPCFIECYAAHRHLHSFPTRRSSDLAEGDRAADGAGAGEPGAVQRPADRGGEGTGPAGRRPAQPGADGAADRGRSEEHTSELQSRENLVCRLLLEKKKYSQPTSLRDH